MLRISILIEILENEKVKMFLTIHQIQIGPPKKNDGINKASKQLEQFPYTVCHKLIANQKLQDIFLNRKQLLN